MKKIKFLFIALAFIISASNVENLVIAAENEGEQIQEESKTTLTEAEINEQKKEILSSINGYLDEINHNIKRIDEKVENTKRQDEFEYYPAVRLNIDTPLFGMVSAVENKLRIKKDVSTTDVANRYSIRNVVENRKIRLPDGYVAGMVVSTKEVEISENLSLAELKLILVRCIQYDSQVDAVEDFVDVQINKFFKDYIAEEKKNNIKDVKERTTKVNRNIEEISDKIYKMSFIGVDVGDYITQYNTVVKEIYDINNKSKNTLMSNVELTELMKNSLTNEANVLDLKTAIDDAYETAVTNMNYLTVLNSLKATYEGKRDRIKVYLDNSTTEKEEATTGESNTKLTVIKNYSVTSENTEEYLDKIIEDIEKKIETYNKEQEELKNANATDNVTESKEKKETDIFEENKLKLDELFGKYKEALNREYKFYTNNVNMLLNDSNSKMTSIIGQIDSNIVIDNSIFNYTKYVYIDLPKNLSSYLEKNNMGSSLEMNNLNGLLFDELETLVQTNMNIKKMYDEMNKELLKS